MNHNKPDKKTSANIIPKISQSIVEAYNVLKYTLQIPYPDNMLPCPRLPQSDCCSSEEKKSVQKNSADFLDKAFDIAYNNCKYFFNDEDVDIFGYVNNNCPDLSLLSLKSDFWVHAFKQEVILAAFDKLRKIIGQSQAVSAYTLTKYSNYANCTEDDQNKDNQNTDEQNEENQNKDEQNKDDYFNLQHHGLDYLTGWADETSENENPAKTHKSYLDIESIKNTIIFNQKIRTKYTCGENKLSSNAPNYTRRIRNMNSKLEGFRKDSLYLFPKVDCLQSQRYTLNTLEFYDFITAKAEKGTQSIGRTNITPILNAHKKEKNFSPMAYNDYITSVMHLLSSVNFSIFDKEVIPTDIKHNLSLSDRLYLRYQIEKIFAPSTIDCMYWNLSNVKNTIRISDDMLISQYFSSCFTLPNVFTRQYILQMAIDTITKHNDYIFHDTDFFAPYNTDPTTGMSLHPPLNESPGSFDFLIVQLNKFLNFTKYLTNLFFPIYENYFFTLLWNSAKQGIEQNDDSNIVVYLYKLLQYYLNDDEEVIKLFSVENTILSSSWDQNNYLLKPTHIIQPHFELCKTDILNYHLYKQCIVSNDTSEGFIQPPDFISLEYLNSFNFKSHPSEYVQAFYINNSLSYNIRNKKSANSNKD